MLLAQASVGLSVAEVLGIVGAVAAPMAATIGVLFKLYLAEVAGRREDAKAATAAILAERAAATAADKPLVESVGKLAAAMSEGTAASRDQDATLKKLVSSVDELRTGYTKLVERALERRRSSGETPAVK
jgi:hypothetical protein